MIDLPTEPSPANVTPGLLYFGSSIIPALGGASQDIERLGTRYKLSITMPPMKNKDLGRVFASRLRRGKSEGVRIAWPLGDFQPGEPGNPTVSLTGATGTTLPLTGFNPGYTVKEGQFFSIISGGDHYLYEAAQDTTAEANGAMALQIYPMIRALHQAADICEFVTPMIQGKVQGQDWEWDLSVASISSIQFEIHERK